MARRYLGRGGLALADGSIQTGPIQDLATTSTATTINPYGVTRIGSTAAKSFRIGTPINGMHKWLFCDQSTTVVIKIIASTGGTIDFLTTAGGKEVLQFNNDGESAHLIGSGTTSWMVISHIGAAYSTS